MALQQSCDPIWEKLFSSQEWGKYPPEHVVRFVARNFYRSPERSAVRLLDVGCGPGANTWFMAREGFCVSGIDGSQTAIAKARKRLAEEDCNAELMVGDLVQLPWPDETFDGAVDNFSLYANRQEAFAQALSEVRRVLKPGAKFISASFTTGCWGYGIGSEVAPDTFVDVPNGPLKNRGLTLFLSERRLGELFTHFNILEIAKDSRTVENMRHVIESWHVTVEKPRDDLFDRSGDSGVLRNQ